MPAVEGIDHVNVRVTDLERSLAFWRDLLGLPEVERGPAPGTGTWLVAGREQIHLSLGTPPPPVGQHVALRVRDRDDLERQLRAAGIPVDVIPGAPTDPPLLFVKDPDGNIVELCDASQDVG